MARKKKKVEELPPVARKCDCWLGKIEAMICYCDLDNKSVRYSVKDIKGFTHSRWETPNEALEDGRKRLGERFDVYDNLEEKTLLEYGGES